MCREAIRTNKGGGKMSVVVIGDSMLDVHTHGTVSRISPEAPVQVVNAGSDSLYSLGAAANVAKQVATAEIPCILMYKAFESDPDGSHERLHNLCSSVKILPEPLLFPDTCFPITTKERIWAGSQQLCRVDREHTQKPSSDLSDEWIKQVKDKLSKYNAKIVVFSDYDKGTLTDYIIQNIADYCMEKGIKTILDPKRFSYWGLQNLTLIKPNNREIAITNMSPKEISKELQDTYLLNTLGKDGMKLWQNGLHLHSVGAIGKESEVIDVCGSGDLVSAALAIGFSIDLNIEQNIRLANKMAYEGIKHRGCHTCSRQKIEESIDYALS